MVFGKKKRAPAAAGPSSSQDAPQQPGDSSTLLAFVMMKSPALPTREALIEAIRQRVADFTIAPGEEQPEGPVVGLSGGRMCAVMLIDQPNPLSSEESFLMSAWWWPDAAAALNERRAHAIVTVMGGSDPRHDYSLLAKLGAAVIDVSDAIGVIWNAADAVWQASLFRDVVEGAGDNLPASVLFSVKLGRDTEYPRADGAASWLGMTYGLAGFGLMEIEIRGFDAENPSPMIDTLINLGSYVLNAGPVIGDGDTIGPDAATQITVRHEASTLNPGATVYRLYLPAPGIR